MFIAGSPRLNLSGQMGSQRKKKQAVLLYCLQQGPFAYLSFSPEGQEPEH
jgi:hypothetical protein